MKKLLFILLGVLLYSCGGSSQGVMAGQEFPKVYTSATAEKRVEPNMARVIFAVLTRSGTADKAREENAKKLTALTERLKKLKIPETDIETLDYRLDEVYSYHNGTQKVDAYEVRNRLQLKLLDVKGVGKMIDELVPMGANKIEDIQFDIAEKEEVYRKLLEEATAQAKEKATRMAEAAGLSKVTVLELREEYAATPMPMAKYAMGGEAAMADSAQTQVIPSTVLKAQVTLTAKARD